VNSREKHVFPTRLTIAEFIVLEQNDIIMLHGRGSILNNRNNIHKDNINLRKQAEELMKNTDMSDLHDKSEADIQRLIHELHVYQVELQLQNEELLQTRSNIEHLLEKYTDLYDFAPLGYFTVDRNSIISQVNLTGAQLLSLDRSLLIDKDFRCFVSPESQSVFRDFIEKAFQSSGKISCRIQLLADMSAPAFVRLDAVAPSQNNECHIAITDITERRHMVDALRASEKRYRGLVESQFDLIVRVNTENQFTFVNEAYCNTFGKSSEELLGSSFAPLVHEDDLPLTLEAMDLLNKPPYRCYVEQRALTVNGWRWLAWEDCAIIDENGKVVEIQAVGRDITDSKKDHEALSQSETRLRTLISNVTGAVYRTTYNEGRWIIQFISDAIEMISGYPVHYFSEKPVEVHTALIHPDDRDIVRDTFQKMIKLRKPYAFEYRIIRADGSIRWILDKGQIIYSDEGELLSLDGILSDITATKHAEEELRKSYNIQKEFLNNISNEVRTPLTAVQGYVRMLMEGTMGSVSDEQAALLNKVIVSSDHLISIVNGVLEIARTKSGSLQSHPKACNPCVIIDTAISSITPLASLKGLRVNVEKPDTQQVAMYDEQKLLIILTNLLTNAVKFTETGCIDIRLHIDSQGMEIIVADTGMGIQPGKLDSIFDEFTQLDYPRKHKPVGFGIGLSIVATMLDSIQGDLTVSSVPNTGTAFTLHAPKLEK